jgi:hypothetical protein
VLIEMSPAQEFPSSLLVVLEEAIVLVTAAELRAPSGA